MKKRVLAVLAAAMCLTTAACGGGGDAKTEAAKTEAAKSETAGAESKSGDTAGASSDTIKLAVVGPLTGDYAEYGKQAVEGAELAAKQVNEAGGILGGRQIEIVSYDDRGITDDGTAIAEKIAADDSIIGIPNMDFQSSVALATGPIYQKAGIPSLSNTSSHPDLAKIGEYIMRNNITDYYEALNTVEACYLRGYKRIAYIGEESDFGVSAGENMEAAVNEIKEKDPEAAWCGSTSFLTGTVDFSAQISELVAGEPDVIVHTGTYESLAPFCVQLRKTGSQIAVAGVGNAYDTNLMTVGGDSVEGLIFPSIFNANSEDPVVKKFIDEFQAENGGKKPNHVSGLCYDATMTLINAMEVTGSDDRETIMKSLYETPYEGITGTCIFDENHECIKPQVVFEVKDGEFQEIPNLLFPSWSEFMDSLE